MSVTKYPEIFEGKNCLQTQISLLKIAPGMIPVSAGVKWCKKQSLFESLHYKGCMGCCYNRHLYGCLPAGPYICYWQWMSMLLEGKVFVLRFWQDRLSTSHGGRGSQRRFIFPVALSASGRSSQSISQVYCKWAWLLQGFTGARWLWEWEENVRFSIWLSEFGYDILAEQRDMRPASLHAYLLQGTDTQPGRTKKSFLARPGAAWVWWVMAGRWRWLVPRVLWFWRSRRRERRC